MIRRRQLVAFLAAAAALYGGGPAAVARAAGGGAVPAAGGAAVPAVRPAGSWGRAIEVPGLAALNKGNAEVGSVSCAPAGSCTAGGFYSDQHRHGHGFVAAGRNGRWRRAVEIPGLATLARGGDAGVTSVSCPSAGNCAAGGFYRDRHHLYKGFVAAERNGRWGRAIEIPGLATLGEDAVLVSCASAGSCAAGGDYTDRDFNSQGFVAAERNGRWGRAIEVPGLAALNTGGDAHVLSVSCAPAGSCAAGGSYTDGTAGPQGFVAVERNGRWHRAIEIPGLAALNTGDDAKVVSVSCASAGSCAAGGDYSNGFGFVAAERNGRWGRAIEIPGLAALDTGGGVGFFSVSCASAGNCAAGGDYTDRHFNAQGFVAVEKNGRWHRAIEVPGLAALNKRDAEVDVVSCGSPGNCAAGGTYTDRRGNSQGFMAVEKNGVWGKAIEIPGLGTLNKGGYAFVFSVSCASAGTCAAGGGYADRGHLQGFVT